MSRLLKFNRKPPKPPGNKQTHRNSHGLTLFRNVKQSPLNFSKGPRALK